MRHRILAPFWQAPPRAGESYSQIEGFVETVEAAERYRDYNLGTLRRCRGFDGLIKAVRECTFANPCRRVLCPLCAREYRIWLADRTLWWFRLAEGRGLSAFALTVRLSQVSNRDLPDVSISRLQWQLRQRMRRAGVCNVIGGTEVSYNDRDNTWTAHFHLLILATSTRAIAVFSDSCAKDGIPRAVDKPRPIKDPIEQLTYLQKFMTMYRDHYYDSRGKGQGRRLRPEQMAPLAEWTESYGFEDFLFLVGFRRYADRIVRARTQKKHERALPIERNSPNEDSGVRRALMSIPRKTRLFECDAHRPNSVTRYLR